MASYSANTSKHWTLTGAQIDTLTLAGNKRALRIQTRPEGAATGVWYATGYTVASTPDPATDGSVDGSFYLPPNSTDVIREAVERDNETANVIKVVSTGAAAVSVESR